MPAIGKECIPWSRKSRSQVRRETFVSHTRRAGRLLYKRLASLRIPRHAEFAGANVERDALEQVGRLAVPFFRRLAANVYQMHWQEERTKKNPRDLIVKRVERGRKIEIEFIQRIGIH